VLPKGHVHTHKQCSSMFQHTSSLYLAHMHICKHSCLPVFMYSITQGTITNMLEENVVQPMLVTSSAITLATECVRMILKIDDIVPVR